MNLTDKTVLITGAAQGIGRAMAQSFAEAGCNLALLDLSSERMDETVRLCGAAGVRVRAYAANVTDEKAVEAVADQIVDEFGRFDGLVNNAGILRDGLLVKVRDGAVIDRMSLQQFRAVIDVNLTGVFLTGRAAAERMIALGNGGVIVNISSISRHGNAGQTNYSAAKAGVVAMADVWSKELARYRIRCASIAPGFVRTDLLASMKPEVLAKVTAPVPLARLGHAAEIAQAARFIFENDYFTGRCIDVDGGLRL